MNYVLFYWNLTFENIKAKIYFLSLDIVCLPLVLDLSLASLCKREGSFPQPPDKIGRTLIFIWMTYITGPDPLLIVFFIYTSLRSSTLLFKWSGSTLPISTMFRGLVRIYPFGEDGRGTGQQRQWSQHYCCFILCDFLVCLFVCF